MLSIPPVGSTVTVTTRYRDDYIFSDEEWDYHTYEDVTVLKPENWFKSTQFKISGTTSKMPFHVIDIRNVVEVTDGVEVEQDSNNRTVVVKGSKGNEYYVTVENGVATSCTCPGFTFRHTCRHLKEITG